MLAGQYLSWWMKTLIILGRPSHYILSLCGGAFSGGYSLDSDIITMVELGWDQAYRSPLPW